MVPVCACLQALGSIETSSYLKEYPLRGALAPDSDDAGRSTGLAVGLALAAVVLVLMCLAMAAVAVVKRRRNSKGRKDVDREATAAISQARAWRRSLSNASIS